MGLSRGAPFETIAVLEAVAALLAVKLFLPQLPDSGDITMLARGLSDNRGNRYALSRLQSTRFPLVVVLMELACVMESRCIRLAVDWAPREWNQEADRLSNLDFTGFNPRHRIDTSEALSKWVVLDKVMLAGMKFYKERGENQRAQRHQGRTGYRTKGKKLREYDPW